MTLYYYYIKEYFFFSNMTKMRNIITLTEKASNKLVDILREQNNMKWMMFSVKSGGCNGFNYELMPTNDKPDEKIDIIVNDHLYVCGKSAMYLIGTNVDWNKTIMGEYFTFDNPLTHTKCGCGTSFTIKQ